MLSMIIPLFLQTFIVFSGNASGNLIPPKAEKMDLTNELRELLFSSPSVLRQLRQVALQNDEESVAIETEREMDRWKRSPDTDNQMALAVALTVMQSLNSQKEKNMELDDTDIHFALNNDDIAWTKETIRLVSRILDCHVDILNPYIKKCSSMRQRNVKSGTISCSISESSSVGCPSCLISSTSVSLQSPNYPNDYQGPWDCEYLLQAAVGEFISIVFEETFVLEKHYDYLLICDGETPNCNDLFRNITGYKTPGNFSRKDNKLSVKFVADDSNLALPTGKTGRWKVNAESTSSSSTSTEPSTTTTEPSTTTTEPSTTTTELSTTTELTSTTTSLPPFIDCTADSGCGTCVNVTLSGGIIQSSNYPQDNQDNLNCRISIAASPNAKILLTFTEFVVEEDYDFVMVYDSSFQLLRGELTGYDIPVPFNVKTNNVTINFQTDANNWVIPGFTSGNSGRWSLNFTVVYPTTATTVQDNTDVSTTTESSTVNPAILGYTCTAECGVCTSLTLTGGIIQSPNYPAAYGNNRNCTIVINTGSSKSRIALEFTEFNVEQDYDFLSVFDADQNRFDNLSGYKLPDTTILKTTKLSLMFNSDENNLGIFSNLPGRWKANFSIISSTSSTTPIEAITTTLIEATTSNLAEETTTTLTATTIADSKPNLVAYSYVCEVRDQNSVIVNYPNLCNIFNNNGGSIQSPNFPNEYPPNLNLTYKITSSRFTRFKISSTRFVVEKDLDFVSVTNNLNTIIRYTGYIYASLTTSSPITVKFETNGDNLNIPADKHPGAWRFTFGAQN